MGNLPKISVVTACYNMENYIEDTINSVLSQNYPNLEYIIVDGASTDHTLDIINKYKDKISLIISEKDDGMYDAINKGFRHATGDIYAWINADDTYFPWTFQVIGRLFAEHKSVQWAIGQTSFMIEQRQLNKIFNFNCSYDQNYIAKGWHRDGILGPLQQESMFWRRELWEKVNGLDINYKLAADFELWTRFAKHSSLTTVALPLAAFYIRNDSLSHGSDTSKKYLLEVENICLKLNSGYPNLLFKLFKGNMLINRLLRLFIWKKTQLYAFSMTKKCWVLKSIRRTVSNTSLSYLWLEWKMSR